MSPLITNEDILAVEKLRAVYQAAIEALILKHQIAVNDLTEKQLAEAIRQACACGDFQRHVCPSNSSQAVIYIPHAREAYLTGRIRELEEQLATTFSPGVCRECGANCRCVYCGKY